MRVLTVRQPWAWAIIHGGKDVENRTCNLAGSWRGPVAIHVAVKNAPSRMLWDEPLKSVAAEHFWDDLPAGARRPWWDNHGLIIGVVDLVGVHRASGCYERAVLTKSQYLISGEYHNPPVLGGEPGHEVYCSPWAQNTVDEYHLVFKNPRPLTSPVGPVKGRLGLWFPTAEVAATVEERVS